MHMTLPCIQPSQIHGDMSYWHATWQLFQFLMCRCNCSYRDMCYVSPCIYYDGAVEHTQASGGGSKYMRPCWRQWFLSIWLSPTKCYLCTHRHCSAREGMCTIWCMLIWDSMRKTLRDCELWGWRVVMLHTWCVLRYPSGSTCSHVVLCVHALYCYVFMHIILCLESVADFSVCKTPGATFLYVWRYN